MPARRLDVKLAKIADGSYTPKDFIIADAKDGDMALGVGVAGPEFGDDGRPTGRMRPLLAYRDNMEVMVQSGLIDVMLTSLSSAEYLAGKGVYAKSRVTPAIRLNDGSDIWHWRGANYRHFHIVPFRTARLDRVKPIADLGLYALTFFNDLGSRTGGPSTLTPRFATRLQRPACVTFWRCSPQFDVSALDTDFATYNNDAIARCLAGVCASTAAF